MINRIILIKKRTKDNMNIGIDVDGVIFDYMTHVRAYAELYDFEILHKKGVVNREEMKVGKRYDWTKEQTKEFGDKYFVELTKTMPIFTLAQEIIERLNAEGNKLFVISNRGLLHEGARTEAQKLFDKFGLKFEKCFWDVSDKAKVCLENNIKVMIDDSDEVCNDCAQNGIQAIYMREKDTPKIENQLVHEVDNWGEIYRVIKQIG